MAEMQNTNSHASLYHIHAWYGHLPRLINHLVCDLHAYQIKIQSETNQALNGLLAV